jgi:hypothetical protein
MYQTNADERTFTTFQVSKALGLNTEQFLQWMKRGYIVPTIAAQGQGSKSLFSVSQVYIVEIFRRLNELGVEQKVIVSKYLPILKHDMTEDIEHRFVLFKSRDKGRRVLVTYLDKNYKFLMERSESEGKKTYSVSIMGSADVSFDYGVIVDLEDVKNRVKEALKGIE